MKLQTIYNRIIGKSTGGSSLGLYEVKGGPITGAKLFGDQNAAWFSTMLDGTYDAEFFQTLAALDLNGKTILDIGAHVGYHALAFAKAGGTEGKVFAFEPNPYNRERFEKNLANNTELAQTITLMPIAVSNKDGEETFIFGERVDKGSSSGSFLYRAHTAWEKAVYESDKIGFKRTSVPTRTIDSLRADGSIKEKISLMKIDVEGAEYLVLEGATKTLEEDRPVIFIEIHSIFNMLRAKELFDTARYELTLLKEESDGRCFFVAKPL